MILGSYFPLSSLQVTSPATRKRTSVRDEFLDNVSSPSKRQSLGAQSASTTQSADGKRKRRPVPAAVYANLQEKPDAPEAGVEPGSGVQSTGVTPLVSRLQVRQCRQTVLVSAFACRLNRNPLDLSIECAYDARTHAHTRFTRDRAAHLCWIVHRSGTLTPTGFRCSLQ